MGNYLLIFFTACGFYVNAQDTSNRFIVQGAIDKPMTVDWTTLKKFKTTTLDSIVLYNYAMNKKGTIRNVKGVLVKDLLSNVVFNEESPKKWSEFYLVCTGMDGYTVVFSWNEIFNSAIGDKAMIITEKNGTSFTDHLDEMALISPADIATGRRYVHGLNKITIRRAE